MSTNDIKSDFRELYSVICGQVESRHGVTYDQKITISVAAIEATGKLLIGKMIADAIKEIDSE